MTLIQMESNSFAVGNSDLSRFTLLAGAATLAAMSGANSEFAGACSELAERGATVVPLLYAHCLPAAPLTDDAYSEVCHRVVAAIAEAGELDGLVVCLHGALTTVSVADGDVGILAAIRAQVGDRVPIALSLDLHANAIPGLLELAQVITGYATNPHVDQAATGRRAAALLCAVMNGRLMPSMAIAKCPALFPDESLRITTGLLGEILDRQLASAPPSVVDVSIFPTQPWLDAPDVGFATVVIANDDAAAARQLAESITREVWERRHEFALVRLIPPDEALALAELSTVRPFIITESADAPTAGASGDSPAMLHALTGWSSSKSVLMTIVDAPAVGLCWELGVGATFSGRIGCSIDARWSSPAQLDGEVVRIGEGEYRLAGIGYAGLSASLGRFAVVRQGGISVLLTELPAWSADPASWRHGALDPSDVDVLLVRSCTDYIANYPESAETAVVADTGGAAPPRLSRLTYTRCNVMPYPLDPLAVY